ALLDCRYPGNFKMITKMTIIYFTKESRSMPIIALNAAQLPSLFVNHGHLVSRLNDRQN
ncbi:hypothetical protein AAULR_18096, partial [Lacticaseibacillus rhamnosus MTCC 5462]